MRPLIASGDALAKGVFGAWLDALPLALFTALVFGGLLILWDGVTGWAVVNLVLRRYGAKADIKTLNADIERLRLVLMFIALILVIALGLASPIRQVGEAVVGIIFVMFFFTARETSKILNNWLSREYRESDGKTPHNPLSGLS